MVTEISAVTRDRSAFDLYLKDIAPNDLLTQEQEASLARRIRMGDRQSFDQMIESNLRFVITIAKEYQGRGLLLEDLIGEGNLGLVHAATRFNEMIGVKFTTYAVWWIRQSILAALAEQARIVRLPVNKVKHVAKLDRIARDLKQRLGREPSPEEIAEESDLTVRQVGDILYAARWHLSLDAPANEAAGPGTLLDTFVDEDQLTPHEELMRQMLLEELETAMASLSPREVEVLKLYFGLGGDEPITLEEIGKRLSLTKERVRQIRDKALNALKHPSRLGKIKARLAMTATN